MNVIFNVAMHPVDRSGKQRAQNECEQHPVFDEDIGRQYEEIETDVLVEERVVCTVGDVIEKPQDGAPISDFCRGNQQSEQTCAARDDPGPWQPIAHDREQVGRRHIARKTGHEGGDGMRRPPSGKTPRKPSVQPKDDSSPDPDRKKDDDFSADCCPENLQITDRRKPQPVNQEVAREPKQDQANPTDNGRNDDPDQGALSWYFPFGSGNPDRHGSSIAEMRDACRLIRGRDCSSGRWTRVREAPSPGTEERSRSERLDSGSDQPIASAPQVTPPLVLQNALQNSILLPWRSIMPRAIKRKEHPLSMRLPETDIAIIDRAATLRGRSRTDFVRDAAVRAAEDVLMETVPIRMSPAGFKAFMAALSGPASPVPQMIELFQRTAPWETGGSDTGG